MTFPVASIRNVDLALLGIWFKRNRHERYAAPRH
jgi:hypothetical protein